MKDQQKKDWLKKLHQSEIKILDEICRICKKHNIKYFLTAGTLIGAVRHKGFVPWDDDIDIGMTRTDFTKFVTICSSELNKEFMLDYYPYSKKSYRLFAKIRLKETIFIEPEEEGLDLESGIWVDIFPYDNVEKANSQKHINQNDLRLKITKLINLKIGMKNYLSEYRKKYKIRMFFADLFLKIIPKGALIKFVNKKILSNKNDDSKYISSMTGGGSLERETHLRNNIFPLIQLDFEGKKYYCPNKYDEVLTKMYGDYMKLPPIEKRVTHNPLKIKFEDGETIEFGKGKNN